MDPITAYPLSWPATWPHKKHRQQARFDTSFARARDGVVRELHLLGAKNIILSTNIPLRQDGLPYARYAPIADPAVAVYFDLNGEQRCIPCDRWDRVEDNMQAIHLTVGALRGLDRWGAKEIVDAAFQGFQALPAGNTSGDAWWVVLGVDRHADRDTITAAYRKRAKETHPDSGGTADAFDRVAQAYKTARTLGDNP